MQTETTRDVRVTIAPEDWTRAVFRTATGITIRARPSPDADEEVHIDLPAHVAIGLAGMIAQALSVPPCTPSQLVAGERSDNPSAPTPPTA